MSEQICTKCGKALRKEFFVKNASYCKECHSKYMKEWRTKNYEKAKRIARDWKKGNLSRVKSYDRKWHKENNSRRKFYPSRKKQKQYTIKCLYGLSLEDYKNLCEKQSNACAICGMKLDDKIIRIDHDHVAKKVRGILCNNCNLGIGHFKENKEYMSSAIAYLKKHNSFSERTRDGQK